MRLSHDDLAEWTPSPRFTSPRAASLLPTANPLSKSEERRESWDRYMLAVALAFTSANAALSSCAPRVRASRLS